MNETIETFPILAQKFRTPTSAYVLLGPSGDVRVQMGAQTMILAEAEDAGALVASLDALTGWGYRRAVLDEVANVADEMRHPNYSSGTGDWVRASDCAGPDR